MRSGLPTRLSELWQGCSDGGKKAATVVETHEHESRLYGRRVTTPQWGSSSLQEASSVPLEKTQTSTFSRLGSWARARVHAHTHTHTHTHTEGIFLTLDAPFTLWMPQYLSSLPSNPALSEGKSRGLRPLTRAALECGILSTHSIWTTDAGEDWRQEEKGATEDEMVGWHHPFDGREFEWALGVGNGQGGLACCSPWGHKGSDTTW